MDVLRAKSEKKTQMKAIRDGGYTPIYRGEIHWNSDNVFRTRKLKREFPSEEQGLERRKEIRQEGASRGKCGLDRRKRGIYHLRTRKKRDGSNGTLFTFMRIRPQDARKEARKTSRQSCRQETKRKP